MLNIEITMDYVVVLGVRIERPVGIARSDWKGYWERAEKPDDADDTNGEW